MDKFYAGYFVAGGALRELCVYPNLECTRDTLCDSMNHFASIFHTEITDAGIMEIDTDGSSRSVEKIALPFQAH